MTCLHSGTEYEMREDIINGILDMCSRDMYKNTQDFAWLVSVLVDLAKTRGSHTGEAISQRLIDITLRVPAVRLITVNYVLPLLLQPDSVCESMKCVLIISLNSGGPLLDRTAPRGSWASTRAISSRTRSPTSSPRSPRPP